MIPIPDLKWLVELIKSGGRVTTGIAVACVLFLLAAHCGWLPPIEPWMVLLAISGLLLFGSLSVVAILSVIIQKWMLIRKKKRAVRNYIKHMTKRERKIISYLLAKNQKTFTGAEDGGHAKTLISQGIVVYALSHGQPYSRVDTPFKIPDYIWSVLMEHKKDFPYTPPPPGEIEVFPWRKNWMEQ